MATMNTYGLQPIVSVPRWLTALYAVVAVGLIPWIGILYTMLPTRHLSRHWDLAWVGFDIGMLIAIALTSYLAYRRSWWVSLSAMAVCTLLVVDAWFDVLTARPGAQTAEALLMAVIVEIPLAIVSLWLAYRAVHGLVNR